MFLKSSFNYINEFYFIFKNQLRRIYLNSNIYNKKITITENYTFNYKLCQHTTVPL